MSERTMEKARQVVHRLAEWYFAEGGDNDPDSPLDRADLDALHDLVRTAEATAEMERRQAGAYADVAAVVRRELEAPGAGEDVRERVAKIVREAMEDARRSERLNTFPQSSMWDYTDRILALLRAPRGEGEAMDADAMWYHWSSGHEVAALLGLRTASDDEAHRFLSMLADWQRCPMPSDHDALRGEGGGE